MPIPVIAYRRRLLTQSVLLLQRQAVEEQKFQTPGRFRAAATVSPAVMRL